MYQAGKAKKKAKKMILRSASGHPGGTSGVSWFCERYVFLRGRGGKRMLEIRRRGAEFPNIVPDWRSFILVRDFGVGWQQSAGEGAGHCPGADLRQGFA